MKLEKIRLSILQFYLEKLFFQDTNFLPTALTLKDSSSRRKRNQKRWWQVK